MSDFSKRITECLSETVITWRMLFFGNGKTICLYVYTENQIIVIVYCA